MNINRDCVSLETKFCSVCVFSIVTPSKLFALVFDFFALLKDPGFISIHLIIFHKAILIFHQSQKCQNLYNILHDKISYFG